MKQLPTTTRSENPNGTAIFHSVERSLQRRLAKLLADAYLSGFVITVELVPEMPLKMGQYHMKGHVRPELMRDCDGEVV